jgi:hypothetical protein
MCRLAAAAVGNELRDRFASLSFFGPMRFAARRVVRASTIGAAMASRRRESGVVSPSWQTEPHD